MRKSRKRSLAWTLIFLALGIFGCVTVQIVVIIAGFVLAIVGFVRFCRKGAQLKDPIYVRKIGLAAYKRANKDNKRAVVVSQQTSNASATAASTTDGDVSIQRAQPVYEDDVDTAVY